MTTPKYTIEFIKKEFAKRDMLLLSTEYKSLKVKLEYICLNHKEEGIKQITWNSFWYGKSRCKSCGNEQSAKKRKHSYDFVKSIFESKNLKLLDEEYIDAHHYLNYTCNKHPDIVQKIKFKNLYNKNIGCQYCCKQRKLNIDIVKNEFESRGYQLLDTEYIANNRDLHFLCSKHSDKIQTITYANFYSGHGCYDCGREITAGKLKLDFETVKNDFEKNDLILLEEDYINDRTPMRYICKKHPNIVQYKKYDVLQQGSGCYYCGYDKISRENHYKWNNGISNLRHFLRDKIGKWKVKSMQFYRYKCVISNKSFAHIHHLYPFSDIIIETLSILKLPIKSNIGEYSSIELQQIEDNFIELHDKYGLGICLTKELHNEFHKTYGYTNFTPENFQEFYFLKTGKEFNLEQLKIKSDIGGVAS